MWRTMRKALLDVPPRLRLALALAALALAAAAAMAVQGLRADPAGAGPRKDEPEIIQLLRLQNETENATSRQAYVANLLNVIIEQGVRAPPSPPRAKQPPRKLAPPSVATTPPRDANKWTQTDAEKAHWLTPFGTRVVPMLIRHRPNNRMLPAHVVGHVELSADHRRHPDGMRSHLYAKDAVKPPHVKRTYVRNLVKSGNHEELASYLKTQLMQEGAGSNTPHQHLRGQEQSIKYLSQRALHGELDKAVQAYMSAPPGKSRNAALAATLESDERLVAAMRDPGFRRVMGLLHGGSSIAAQKKSELSGHIAGAGINPLALTGIDDPGARLAKLNMRATHTVTAADRAHSTKVMNQRGWGAKDYAPSGHAIHAAKVDPKSPVANLLAKPHAGTVEGVHPMASHPGYHAQAYGVSNLGKQVRQHHTRVRKGIFDEHAQQQESWTATGLKAGV